MKHRKNDHRHPVCKTAFINCKRFAWYNWNRVRSTLLSITGCWRGPTRPKQLSSRIDRSVDRARFQLYQANLWQQGWSTMCNLKEGLLRLRLMFHVLRFDLISQGWAHFFVSGPKFVFFIKVLGPDIWKMYNAWFIKCPLSQWCRLLPSRNPYFRRLRRVRVEQKGSIVVLSH